MYMIANKKLSRSVPTRVQVTTGPTVACKGWKDRIFETEDSDKFYSLLRDYDEDLRIQSRLRTCRTNDGSQHTFSSWDWDTSLPVSQHPLPRDDYASLTSRTGSMLQVLAWDRVNVIWNMAVVKGQQAAITSVNFESGCAALVTAIVHIEESIRILNEHLSTFEPTLSVVSAQNFLRAWIGFLKSQLQRLSHAHLETDTGDEIPCGLYAGSAAAGAITMATVMALLQQVEPVVQDTMLVKTWKESSQGWGIIFRMVAEYHESLLSNHEVRVQRLRALCTYANAFDDLCNTSKTGILTGLKEKFEQRKRSLVDHAHSFLMDQALSLESSVPPEGDLPCIPPLFYNPVRNKKGFYDRCLVVDWPKRDYDEPLEDLNELVLATKSVPDDAFSDFHRTCEEARNCRRWVLLVTYDQYRSNSRSLHRVLKKHPLIVEIIGNGFLLCENVATELKSFVEEHQVSIFPFVAIVDPFSRLVHSSWSVKLRDSESLIAETLADACLRIGSSELDYVEPLEDLPEPVLATKSMPNDVGSYESDHMEPSEDSPEPVLATRSMPNDALSVFDRTCEKARYCRRWVLVAIYARDWSKPFYKLSLRQVIKKNPFIIDTIRNGFLLCENVASELKSFVEEHKVSEFPFVAIVDPFSQTMRWSWSDLSQSESLIAETLADACLRFGSYDPYEGLSTNEVANRPKECDPPTHLVYTAGGFRAALQEAAGTNRWMLVNLQSDGCLSSHNLNRDVWRDETVESILKENFVFWQKFEVSDEGKVYAKVFNVKSFPHVSILDPFSGLIMWRKEGWSADKPLTSAAFVEAYLSLPSLEEPERPSSRRSSIADTVDNHSLLSSLFDSWERLSVVDMDESRFDFEMASIDESSSWANIVIAPSEQTVSMEIFSTSPQE